MHNIEAEAAGREWQYYCYPCDIYLGSEPELLKVSFPSRMLLSVVDSIRIALASGHLHISFKVFNPI